MLTERDQAAVAFDSLMTFMVRCDFGTVDSKRMIELLEDAQPDSSCDQIDRDFITAAIKFTRSRSDLDKIPEAFRERLVFDHNVSDISPVIKGTWVTVSHVINLIVDGWTWGDVLRCHPELTEDDIRSCLAYAYHEEMECGQ